MYSCFILLVLLMLNGSPLLAQVDSSWSATFGGIDRDVCHDMVLTDDGHYLLAGYTENFGSGSYDFWLVKAGSDGDSVWSRSYGGGSQDECSAICATADGGYLLAGYSIDFGPGIAGGWIVKVNAAGDSLWSNGFGGASLDFFYDVEQTSDGGFILAGFTTSFGAGQQDGWIVKTDANGTAVWSTTFGGTSDEQLYSVAEVADGYLAAGLKAAPGLNLQFWLVKTDLNGDSLWARHYGGPDNENLNAMLLTADGDIVLVGGTPSFGAGSLDFWLLKLNANGDSLWSRTYGGTNLDDCNAVCETNDGGFILAGRTRSFGASNPPYEDFWVVKTDSVGDSLWSRAFGGPIGDEPFAVVQSPNSQYAAAGYTRNFGAGDFDCWIVGFKDISRSPMITEISDVGNDQGRRVRIYWDASSEDRPSAQTPVTAYSIYRRIEEGFVVETGRQRNGTLDWPAGDWEYVSTVPARAEHQYAATAATLGDSISLGTHWSAFFISAETGSPAVYYDSPVDSGYSVDNLAPEPTLITAGLEVIDGEIVLRWEEITTGGEGQEELNGIWYRVHGSSNPDFVPGSGNLLGTTQALSFAHAATEDQFYYRVLVSDDY